MKHPILVVEDDPMIARLLKDYLVADGFTPVWLKRGDEVSTWLANNPTELMLLDLTLPGRTGMDICREVRGQSSLPIIIMSGRTEELDRLLGLELGADDYICKPFSPREVVARIRTVLRRVAPSPAPEPTHLTLDEDTYRAQWGKQDLGLTLIEFQLLRQLASRPGRLFTRAQLIEGMYRDDRVVTERTVDSHIRKLRRKIEAVAPDYQPIKAMYGVGYRFE